MNKDPNSSLILSTSQSVAKQPTPPISHELEVDKTPSSIFDDYLVTMSSLPYFAAREALYKRSFERLEETPWPTATLERGGIQGYAQLRPPILDSGAFLDASEREQWVAIMWKHCEELSDVDADVLDAMSAFWLAQARNVDSSAKVRIDEFLSLRALTPKPGGQGRRGGYRDTQRKAILRALWHIQNLWLSMGKLEVFFETSKTGRRRKPKVITADSRAFVITDSLGQVNKLDGSVKVEALVFRPGKVFAHYLFGPGRQTALLAAKALHYNPYRQTFEKRLARYLSWQWRAQARAGIRVRPYRISTLLGAVGTDVDPQNPHRTRERLEKALDVLVDDQILAAWQYERFDDTDMPRQGWIPSWLQATVLIEAPDRIKEHYQPIERRETPLLPQQQKSLALSERLRMCRKERGLTQLQAAEQLEISQGYVSLLERAKISENRISEPVRTRIECWLEEP